MKQNKTIKWSGRIIALIILVLGLPFYFGYGNPLPFVNPDYTWIENFDLALVPFVFIGLALGWKYKKLGGYFIIIPLVLGFLVAIIAGEDFPVNMLIALIPGVLYLIDGYN